MFQYARIPSILANFDAISKFFWLVCIAILVFIYPPLLNLILLFVILISALVLGKMGIKRVMGALSILLVLAMLFLIGGIFYGKGEPIFYIGSLPYTWEALTVRGAAAARIVNVMLSSMVFVWVTNPRDLVTGLVQLGLPYRLAFTIFVGLNYIPILTHEMEYINDAQKLRGLRKNKSIPGILKMYQTYIVAILLRSLRKAQITAYALDSKAFGAYIDRTYLNPFRWTTSGLVWLGIWIVIVIASLVASIGFHLFTGHYFAF